MLPAMQNFSTSYKEVVYFSTLEIGLACELLWPIKGRRYEDEPILSLGHKRPGRVLLALLEPSLPHKNKTEPACWVEELQESEGRYPN